MKIKLIIGLAGLLGLISCIDSKCPSQDCHAPDCVKQDCGCGSKADTPDIQKEVFNAEDINAADRKAEGSATPQKCAQSLEPQGILSLKTQGYAFVDSQGRRVIFHGINISGMEWGKTDVFTRKDLHAIAMAGFNAVRFPIGWTGIEPQKDKIDADYLAGIKQVVNLAEQEGLYVMIDMHQWLWCTVGMPRWTCLEDPKMDTAQVMNESRHFFGSKTLKATLAKRWGLIAGMFADRAVILGYDLFNEPTPVSVDAALSGAFDLDYLAPFYKEVIAAIRKMDQNHVLILEPNVAAITGNTAISRPKDPLIAFSPHYYCPHNYVEGKGLVWLIPPSPDLLRAQYEEGAKIQKQWDCPVLVGEFGMPLDKDEGPEWLDTSLAWQENLNFSSFYWDYTGSWGAFDKETKNIKASYLYHLVRPYPAAVAGHDLHWSSRAWSGWMDMDYQAGSDDLCKITEVIVPSMLFNNGPEISVDGPVNWRFDKADHRLLIHAVNIGKIVVKIR